MAEIGADPSAKPASTYPPLDFGIPTDVPKARKLFEIILASSRPIKV